MKETIIDTLLKLALVATYLWFTLTLLGCSTPPAYGAKATTIKLIPKSCIKHNCFSEVFKQHEPDAILVLNSGDWLVRWDKWLDFEWKENEQ